MRKQITGFVGALALTVSAACVVLADEREFSPRPMEEMHGSCDNYRWDMSQELALWNEEANEIVASPVSDTAPSIDLATRYSVTLSPHADVVFAAMPEKDRGGEDRFSGILLFEVPEDGLYRISASSGLWIDAVAGNKIVSSSGFEMQTKCETVFKSVVYRLKSGTGTVLQLNGSRSSSVDIAITRMSAT